MRRKARAKKALSKGVRGNANSAIKAKENRSLKALKQTGRTTNVKVPTGKGLGKAGAKRLGRLLKRAIQEEPGVNGKVSLPKTPVRLFKHQIQTEAANAFKTNMAKPAYSQTNKLILSMVSQCKHRGGMSMAELKETLAAAGYNFNNGRQVSVVTKRLIINETLVRTRRNSSFRLNREKPTDTNKVMTSNVKYTKTRADHLKQSQTANKSARGTQRSKRQARQTPKPRGKEHKQKTKSRKPAAKSHKPRAKTPKAGRKMPKPARMKRSTQRQRRKQNQHPNKSSQKRQPWRQNFPKTRLKKGSNVWLPGDELTAIRINI